MGNTTVYLHQRELKKKVLTPGVEQLKDLTPEERSFAIYYACKHSLPETAKHLISKGECELYQDPYTRLTALHYSLEKGYDDIFEALVKQYTTLDDSLMVLAMEKEKPMAVFQLLEKCPCLTPDNRGYYPLNYACLRNEVAIISKILEKDWNRFYMINPFRQGLENCGDDMCHRLYHTLGIGGGLSVSEAISLCEKRQLTRTIKTIIFDLEYSDFDTFCSLVRLPYILQTYIYKKFASEADEKKILQYANDHVMTDILVTYVENDIPNIHTYPACLFSCIFEGREDLAIKVIEKGFSAFEFESGGKPIYQLALEKKMGKVIFLLENKYVRKQSRPCLICKTTLQSPDFELCMKPKQHFS